MQLVTFVFTSNLNPSKTASVKASCMKHAVWEASKLLGCSVANLQFLRVESVQPYKTA